MSSNRISRREFLRLGAVTAAGAALAGCGPKETAAPTAVPPTVAPTAKPTAVPTAAPTAAPVSMYQESPMLAAKVEAGELPPVDERLP